MHDEIGWQFASTVEDQPLFIESTDGVVAYQTDLAVRDEVGGANVGIEFGVIDQIEFIVQQPKNNKDSDRIRRGRSRDTS